MNLRGQRRSRQGTSWAALSCLALITLACTDQQDRADTPAPPVPMAADTTSVPVPGANRAEVVSSVLNLEGSREPMTYHLFRSPADFPMSFSTYVPADVHPEEASSRDEAAVRFLAAFEGARSEDTFVSVRFPRQGITMARARARAREIADSLGRAEPGEGGRYPWSLEWYQVQGEGGHVGTVALARHQDRFFYVVTWYPAEAGNGFAPRAKRVLDEWRWAEGGGLGT